MEKAARLMNLYSSSTHYAGLLLKTGKHKYYRITTDLLAAVLGGSVVLLLAACCLLFLSIGAAFWLSETLGSLKLAFFIVGGFYFLVIVLVAVVAKAALQLWLKNLILGRVSEFSGNYKQYIQQEQALEKELDAGEIKLRADYESVKEEFKSLTSGSGNSEQTGDSEKNTLPRKLIGSAVEFLLGNFVLRGAGPIKRAILPVVANAFIKSRLFKEKKSNGFLSGLRQRLFKSL